MGRLTGKRALITGAGAGIGRATAVKFAEEDAHVIATDVSDRSLEKLGNVAERSVLDVTDASAIMQLANKTEPVDVLFNCAAIVHHGTFLDAKRRIGTVSLM